MERAQYLAAIDRLAKSRVLHGSESLCRLLRYLRGAQSPESWSSDQGNQLATEVFGRSPDFDPQLDSAIRVQAGRLRLKLAEYYSAEGQEDPVVVDLPKGNYALSFHARSLTPKPHL